MSKKQLLYQRRRFVKQLDKSIRFCVSQTFGSEQRFYPETIISRMKIDYADELPLGISHITELTDMVVGVLDEYGKYVDEYGRIVIDTTVIDLAFQTVANRLILQHNQLDTATLLTLMEDLD